MLRSPWARKLIVIAFFETGAMFGAFTYVGADLHLRFGLNFALVGLFVGAFAIGGLIYSLSVRRLVSLLGQAGLAAGGGTLLAAAFVTLAFEPHAYIAPFAILVIGLGFYMLHNTLQTNATQMTPEARGTARRHFLGRALSRTDRGRGRGGAGVRPLPGRAGVSGGGAVLLALGLWFARTLKARAMAGL